MIVVETTLRSIFSQLPDVTINGTAYPVNFDWGSQKDCNLRLASFGKTSNNYPLIWMVQTKEKHNTAKHTAEKNLKLIIAVNSKHKNSGNPKVWDTEFVDVLNPLAANVIKALEKSGVTTIINSEFDLDKKANYSETDETKTYTIDNWNVVVFEGKVRFDDTGNCINTIRF